MDIKAFCSSLKWKVSDACISSCLAHVCTLDEQGGDTTVVIKSSGSTIGAVGNYFTWVYRRLNVCSQTVQWSLLNNKHQVYSYVIKSLFWRKEEHNYLILQML